MSLGWRVVADAVRTDWRWRVIAGALGLSACLAVLMTFVSPAPTVYRGSWDHIMLGAVAAIFVCVPAGLLAVGFFLASFKWQRRTLRGAAAIAASIAILVASVPASSIGGSVMAALDVRRAKRYCEQLVPALDAHRARFGEYPEKIDTVLSEGDRLPRLLRDREGLFYVLDADDSFRFEFTEPRDMLESWYYTSRERWWHYH